MQKALDRRVAVALEPLLTMRDLSQQLRDVFPTRLRDVRKARQMTQEALAREIEVSSNTIRNWETGRSIPDVDLLLKLSDALKASTDYLLGNYDEPERLPKGYWVIDREVFEKFKSTKDPDALYRLFPKKVSICEFAWRLDGDRNEIVPQEIGEEMVREINEHALTFARQRYADWIRTWGGSVSADTPTKRK